MVPLYVQYMYIVFRLRLQTALVCTWSDVENCEGWLSPGGHSSGGRALIA